MLNMMKHKYRFVLLIISVTIISLYSFLLYRDAKADELPITPDQAKQIVRDWMPDPSMVLNVVSTGDVFYKLCESGKNNTFSVNGVSGVVERWRNQDAIGLFKTLNYRDISEKAIEEGKLPLTELHSIVENFLSVHDPQYSSMNMVCTLPWTSCFSYAQRINGNIINADNMDNCAINEYTGELLAYEVFRRETPQLSALPSVASNTAQQTAYAYASQLQLPVQGPTGVAESGIDPALVLLFREMGLWVLQTDESYRPFWLFEYVLSSNLQYSLQQYNEELIEGPGMAEGLAVVIQVDAATGEASVEPGHFLSLTALSAGVSPTISPAAGTYSTAQTVTITSTNPLAVIRYTIDGSRPIHTSPQYNGPITVSTTTTIKARAYIPNYRGSEMVVSAYVIQP